MAIITDIAIKLIRLYASSRINFYKLVLRSLLLRFYKYLDNRLFSLFWFLVDTHAKLLLFNFYHTKIEFDNYCVIKIFFIHNKYWYNSIYRFVSASQEVGYNKISSIITQTYLCFQNLNVE